MSFPCLFLLNLPKGKGSVQGHMGSEKLAEKQQLSLLLMGVIGDPSRGLERAALTREGWVRNDGKLEFLETI